MNNPVHNTIITLTQFKNFTQFLNCQKKAKRDSQINKKTNKKIDNILKI